jgi:hypothetical protein
MRVCFAAAVFGMAAGAFADDTSTFRSAISLVKVTADVSHRRSHAPIVDLQASDFEVSDEGQRREIVYFEKDSGPLDLLLLLDVSGSVREILPEIASGAAEALAALQPGDRAAVMAFSKTTAVTFPLSEDFQGVAQGIRAAMSIHIGTDTDINQAIWSATGYLYSAGGTARRAILILTDNMQETRVPDSLVDEQLSYAGVVLDGLLFRGAIALPHLSHPGILGFARNTGGEIVEGSHPESRVGETIRRIKLRYAIHFRPAESTSPRQRRIGIELTGEARGRYPDAVIRARRIYFPFAAFRHKPAILPAGIALSNRGPELDNVAFASFAKPDLFLKAPEAVLMTGLPW